MFEDMTQEDCNELMDWINKQKHLPSFMRDFHDQKDLFKAIGGVKHPIDGEISWMDGHVYTIDKFLRIMAMHGYTLQKCKAKKPFANISKSIQQKKVAAINVLKKCLKKRKEDNYEEVAN